MPSTSALAGAAAAAAALALAVVASDASANNVTFLAAQLFPTGCANGNQIEVPFAPAGNCTSFPGISMRPTCTNGQAGMTYYPDTSNCTGTSVSAPMTCQDVQDPTASAGSSATIGFGYGCLTVPGSNVLEWVIKAGCGDLTFTFKTYLILNTCQRQISIGSVGSSSYKVALVGTYPNINVTASLWSANDKCSGAATESISAPLSTVEGEETCVEASGSSAGGGGGGGGGGGPAGRRLSGSANQFRLLGDARLAPTTSSTSGPRSSASSVEVAGSALGAALVALAAVVA